MVELQPGQLVRSLAGRDKGRHYLVLQEIDHKYVLLVDGRRRPVARPKKKNKAHLQHYERRAVFGEDFNPEKLSDGRVIELLKQMAPPGGDPDGAPNEEV